MEDNKDYKALTNTTREENLNSIIDEFGVRYTSDGKKLISTPVSLMGEYKIKPGTESICDSAFQYKVDLIKVEIPSSVKFIGRCAFVHCERLITARLPEQLEYMGDMAFTACHLMSVIIPETLHYVPSMAFAGNRELAHIILHDNVEYIDFGAFMECWGFEQFIFPPKIKVVESEVLRHCKNLKEIVLPEGLLEIRNMAFAETPIETVKIPDSVDRMDDYIFSECWRFKGAKIPERAKNIAKHALAIHYERE